MNRREFLTTTALSVSIVLAGCSDGAGTDTATTTPTSTSTPDIADDVTIRIHDGTSSDAETVHVQLRKNGTELLDVEKSVPPEDPVYVHPGIEDTGTYELALSLGESRTRTVTFDIGDYDLRAGSNVIVTIQADSLLVLKEQ